MNIEEILKIFHKNTKLIIATHIYNYPIEIDKLKEICQKKIFLIEDVAEVFGQKFKGKMCGKLMT